MNNEFLRQYTRISKKHSGNMPAMINDLKEQFTSLLRDFPNDLAIDLTEYFIQENSTEEDLQRAADVIDIYNEELDGEVTVLTNDDWIFLKEQINSSAMDLDIDWVAYFMQFILDRHIL